MFSLFILEKSNKLINSYIINLYSIVLYLVLFIIFFNNTIAYADNTNNLDNYKSRNISIIGKTYNVIEKDMFEIIKNKINNSEQLDKYRKELKDNFNKSMDYKGIVLPPSSKDYSYSHTFNYSLKENINISDGSKAYKVLKGTKINPIFEFKNKYSFAINNNPLIKDLIVFNPCNINEVKVLKSIIINQRKNNRPYTLISSGCSQRNIKKLNLNVPIYTLDNEMVRIFNLKNTISLIKFDFLNNQFKIKVFNTTNLRIENN